MAAKNPIKYMSMSINPCTLNGPHLSVSFSNILINKVYTGNRAEQLINGVTKMVIKRSFLFSMLRDAMILGTAQAIPPINGTIDLPFIPNGRIILSMIKPTRAM